MWGPIWPVCICLSVVRFLLTDEGECVRPLSDTPGREGLKKPRMSIGDM